jgi:hypothetical protein
MLIAIWLPERSLVLGAGHEIKGIAGNGQPSQTFGPDPQHEMQGIQEAQHQSNVLQSIHRHVIALPWLCRTRSRTSWEKQIWRQLSAMCAKHVGIFSTMMILGSGWLDHLV